MHTSYISWWSITWLPIIAIVLPSHCGLILSHEQYMQIYLYLWEPPCHWFDWFFYWGSWWIIRALVELDTLAVGLVSRSSRSFQSLLQLCQTRLCEILWARGDWISSTTRRSHSSWTVGWKRIFRLRTSRTQTVLGSPTMRRQHPNSSARLYECSALDRSDSDEIAMLTGKYRAARRSM